MCGGFVCALGADPRRRLATLRRHLLYNGGRITTYCFLGALAGFLGAALIIHYQSGANPVIVSQRLLALLAGTLMIVAGLSLLGYFNRWQALGPGIGGWFYAGLLRDLLKIPGPATPLAFGVFNGMLPCPLVYAFVAQAAASGGPLPGLLLMLFFGLGTFPAMLLVAAIGSRLNSNWRLRGVRLAGLFIVGFGLITLLRGAVSFTEHNQSALLTALAWCSGLTALPAWPP